MMVKTTETAAVAAIAKRAMDNLTSPPPAKRLKQACLPFKIITAVERNVASSQQKRELSNYADTEPVEAKVHPTINDTDSKTLTVSIEIDSYKENKFLSCQDLLEPEIEIIEPVLVADKNQRPISDYLSPSKRRHCIESMAKDFRDCKVVIRRVNLDRDVDSYAMHAESKSLMELSPLTSTTKDIVSSKSQGDGVDIVLDSSFNESVVVNSSVNKESDTKLDDTNVTTVIEVSSESGHEKPTISSSSKKVKRFRKVKKDPAIELEKERLKEERRKAQVAKEKLKAELCRMKAEKMQQKLQEKQEKKQKEECEKQEKLRLKDEEKKKKQDLLDEKERIKGEKKEEENRKNEKTKAAFVNFFIKKSPTPQVWQKPKNLGTFLPFQVKENMRLAPAHRNESCNTPALTQMLDTVLSCQPDSMLYLEEIKSAKTMPRSTSRTWTLAEKDVILIENGHQKTPRKAKLLQFEENVRPPYWGTWCKRSCTITPRNPLKKDENFFDYQVDSDDEWADEEPGESLSHSEGEKESEDDYEVDNDLFVPHGYLSEEEVDDDDKEAVSPDALKAQLKIKEQEFQKDRKNKCLQIKPIVFGCIWMESDQIELKNVLEEYSAVAVGSFPIETRFSLDQPSGNKTSPNVATQGFRKSNETPKGSSAKKSKEIPIEAMPYLIRLVHGNQHSWKMLCNEFQEFWRDHVQKKIDQVPRDEGCYDDAGNSSMPDDSAQPPSIQAEMHISKVQLERTIKRIAKWGKFPEKGPLTLTHAWYVMLEERQQWGLTDLPIPNRWEYCGPLEAVKKSALVRSENHKLYYKLCS